MQNLLHGQGSVCLKFSDLLSSLVLWTKVFGQKVEVRGSNHVNHRINHIL